ncbi:hypothetical protein EZY14_002820 [Kordia sp. TARA_039_SRF]|nr:hypothetical protein EZY14_002820 [Kordia sp. TARA_039_SRF]
MDDILKSQIEFKNGSIQSITVLVEFSEGDIRAIQSTTTPRSGYFFIPKDAELSNDLLQQVAGYGMEVEAKKVFKKL